MAPLRSWLQRLFGPRRRPIIRSQKLGVEPLEPRTLLDAGRLSGKRIFFRSEAATPKLTFADDVYDLVVCNAGLDEMDDPEAAIADFTRVTKPGGRVAVTMPLAGTFGEFYDLYHESPVGRHRIRVRLCARPP